MKIFHEAPISVFKDVQSLTDGDYILAHLYATNELYRQCAQEAVNAGREVILDNSVYELSESFNIDMYVDIIKELKPSWYVIPDVLYKAKDTVDLAEQFVNKYSDLPGKSIGVVQGSQISNVIACYKRLEKICDKIAFSMAYEKIIDPSYTIALNTSQIRSFVRDNLIEFLDMFNVINRNKPHHILGVLFPQEVTGWGKKYPWIDSIDTSNPVMYGLKGYTYFGLRGTKFKPEDKMADNILQEVLEDEWQKIEYNIKMFRRICNE